METNWMHRNLRKPHPILKAESVGIVCKTGDSFTLDKLTTCVDTNTGSMHKHTDVRTFSGTPGCQWASCSIYVANISSLGSSTRQVPAGRVGLHTRTQIVFDRLDISEHKNTF